MQIIDMIYNFMGGMLEKLLQFRVFGTNILYILISYVIIRKIIEFFFKGEKKNGKWK